MILVLQKNTPEPAIRQLLAKLALQNVKGGCVAGETSLLLPLVGETWRLDPAALQALPYVQEARRLTPAYHLAARSTHPENTVVPVGDVRVGADFCLIAGPCAVESAYQIQTVAAAVKAAGAVMLRGGAFKPRTSPYTFQGLGEQGAALLVQAGRDTGLPTVTEITDKGCTVKNVQTGETFFVECDSVVNGIGFVPTPVGGKTASRKVKGRETIHRVGDCVAIGNLRTVIWRAWDVCMKI